MDPKASIDYNALQIKYVYRSVFPVRSPKLIDRSLVLASDHDQTT